jgi:transcription initiation factor TFIID subunit 5
MNNPSQSSEAIKEPSSESPLNPQTPSQNASQNPVSISQVSNIQPNIQPAPPANSQNPPEQALNQSSSVEAIPPGEINVAESEDDPNSRDPKSSDPVPRPPQTLDTVIKNFFQGRGYPIDIPTAASISTQLIASNPQPTQSSFQNSTAQHQGFQNSGFKDTGALAPTPSNNFSNDDEFAEVLRQHALSSQPSDYSNSYLEYRNWSHNSLEMYKTELSSLLYPLFIHSYLDLLYRQEISEARSFFERFYEDHTTYFSEDLQKFKALTLSSNPMDHELVKTFRGNKFGIKVSKNGFRLMIGHLSESPYLLNLRIINKWVNVVGM